MGRPATHTVDSFLDAATRLFAEGGARAVTMAAVARETGAPSGSVYHRFTDRAALFAALWLRTVGRFEAGVLEAIEGVSPAEAPVVAATWAIDWSRENLGEAIVLYAGPQAFSPETWSAESQAALAAHDEERDRNFAALLTKLAAGGVPRDEIALVMFDLPYAVMGRYLGRGKPPPAKARDLVARVAAKVVAPPDRP